MRIRVKIILALLIGTFCFTTYGVQAANVQASKEKMSGYGRSEKARKELKKRKKSKKADVSLVKELTPEQQRRYDYFFLEAARLKVQKDYDAAFDVLQHCLTINPNASSALYEMAQYYMYLKQVPLGQAALEKAVENAPHNYWYAQGLANLYMQQNETERAAALLENMAVRFSDKLDPLYNLLEIYNRQEEYDKVIGILNKLEERMGKNEQLSMEKFRIYLQKKDDKSAFHEIESLVEEYPNDMRYQVVLGDVYMQNGKKQEAYEIYKKVLAEEPDNAMAMYSLASYYEETGQKELYEQQLDTLLLNKKVASDTKLNVMRQFIVQNEQAGKDSTRVITLFNRIMEQEPDEAQLPLLYAQYLLSKGMNKEAGPVLRQVLAIDPTNTAARMTLLGEAVRQEDYKEIMNLCEAGVESNPDMLEFYFYLAIAYNQAERTDDALAICQKALSHVKDDSKKEVVSDFYAIIGDAYHTKNLHAEAYAAYDSALVYNPSNIGALNNYAYYLSVERRDLDKAEEMSYKTVKAEPNNSTYLDTYAWILFVKGNYAEARLYIDEAIKNDKDSSDVVLEHCGDIYYMTGDAEGALKYWKQAWDKGNRSDTLKQKIQKRNIYQMKLNLLNDMARICRLLSLLLLLAVGLAGCKTSRHSSSLSGESACLSSKVQLTVPHKDATLTVNGTMKLKKEECMQISFLMPILRTEVARMEVTPDEILLVDRMGKRYVRATRKELKDVLPKKADFAHLEKLLYAASKPNGKKVLTGKELGIPSLEKGKIELSNFSDKPFALTPTQLSQKYKEVELEELLEMLMDL